LAEAILLIRRCRLQIHSANPKIEHCNQGGFAYFDSNRFETRTMIMTAPKFYMLWLLVVFAASVTFAQDHPIPAAEATKHFKLPAGFQATLFAGEPDLVQPIAFTFDDRGRLWVVENHSYPGWKSEHHDRVLIFTDRDGDGRFDEKKVFLENGSNLTGIELGFGGVWLCSVPNLVFVPDANGDDVPDGPPVVKLDGWDITAKHNVFNSLTWGPDGWLYGCNGILSNSKVGKPGSPAKDRTALNCGVWRYHPTRETFEVVASGTTNPWGLDFDQYGQAFITNCVIHHLWHVVPGAHFQRMFGEDLNRYTYQLMDSCADHLHWTGANWWEARGEKQNDFGGGHAHVGAMIYQGDNWPAEYRNHVFMCNVHGNRVNQDVLERKDSGYVAHHGTDFLLAGDPWFRGLAVKCGPDGGVYLSDWTDTGECHNYEVVDRSNGRIFKITYGDVRPWSSDLAKLGDDELAQMQRHPNRWVSNHALRLLYERYSGRGKQVDQSDPIAQPLVKMLTDEPDATLRLRALWALNALGVATEPLLLEQLKNKADVVRGWTVRLAVENKGASPAVVSRLAEMAAEDPSAWVRLALASALQRLPANDRWGIAKGLVSHAQDAADVNLSLMIWYGTETFVSADRGRAIELIELAKIPLIQKLFARRIAAANYGETLTLLIPLLKKGSHEVQEPILAGMLEALEGRRDVPMPKGWSDVYPMLASSSTPPIKEKTRLLALIFNDPRALDELRGIAADAHQPAEARREAIVALAQAKAPGLPKQLRGLLADSAVRVAALRGLAASDDEATPGEVLKKYGEFDAAARQEAISTLAARKNYATFLLDALEQHRIPAADVSAFHVQQLQNLKDVAISGRLEKVWGKFRPTSADRAALIAKYKQQLTPTVLAGADRAKGRAVFNRTCAACHTLFDAGGKIGPQLTGAQRNNLDYLLSNVLDPSAVVAKDYQMTLLVMADGRVISGIIKSEDDRRLTVQTATELITVIKNEIDSRDVMANSMMPDGLLQPLGEAEVRDLMAYLMGATQVPVSGEHRVGGK
jgi:putative membrane-bound dehydrogenase-like protein